MRVVINRLAALKQKTGVGHYTEQLVRHLRHQAGAEAIADFPAGLVAGACRLGYRLRPFLDNGLLGRRSSHRVGKGDSPRDFRGTVPFSALARLRGGTAEALRRGSLSLIDRYFGAVCRREHYDLYHEPNFIPLTSAADHGCPTLATLHDLSALLHPEWHPPDRVRYFAQHMPRALERCLHFVTGSEFTRKEVIRELGIAPERVTRIYYGIHPELRPLPEAAITSTLRRFGLPRHYLLHVGTIEPRKNLLMLLQVYCGLPESLRSRWPLVLAGGWGWKASAVAEYLDREARRRGVIHVGYVDDQHLPALYNGARALLYPSLYEGFGLPPLEMMACGGAVLASNAAALAETVGGQAHLIAPDDTDAWRAALLRLLTDDDWWQSLRRGAQNVARPYSWDRCAAETLQLYRQLCEPKRGQCP